MKERGLARQTRHTRQTPTVCSGALLTKVQLFLEFAMNKSCTMLLKCSVIDSISIRHKKQNSHDGNDLDVADTEITNRVLSSKRQTENRNKKTEKGRSAFLVLVHVHV